jgi:elongation factor G
VAHIDAGKTTTTERMLFYSGSVRRIGEVDSGTTTTDYLEEERERGVTITAAAVTFLWKGHQVNLIDTPGHVDFTVEVERSLRVLDGVVALFDAAVGVEAQSYTVLRQARRHKIPLIAYINKMDKSNADFNLAVNSIRKKLQVEPLLVQVPLLENDGSFSGIVDLVKGIAIRFEGKDGENVVERSIESQQHHVKEAFQQGRHELLAALSSRDDAMAEALIVLLDQFGGDEAKAEAAIDEKTLRETIRRQTLKSMVQDEVPLVPVLCGASRRNMGVQTLMDAVVSYLPSPLERPVVIGRNTANESTPLPHPPSSEVSNNFIALAFKVIHIPHPQTKENRGLVFFRCYSGRISNKQEFLNTTTGKTEKIEQLYVMHANEGSALCHARGDRYSSTSRLVFPRACIGSPDENDGAGTDLPQSGGPLLSMAHQRLRTTHRSRNGGASLGDYLFSPQVPVSVGHPTRTSHH